MKSNFIDTKQRISRQTCSLLKSQKSLILTHNVECFLYLAKLYEDDVFARSGYTNSGKTILSYAWF